MYRLFALGFSLLLVATGAIIAAERSPHLPGTNVIGTPGQVDSASDKEYEILVARDDEAHEQVDGWIDENNRARAKRAGVSDAELNRRILQRFEPVKKDYADFIQKHPDHLRARLAYGGFLNEANDEAGAEAQWERAQQLDPKNPAAYNNLASRYAESEREDKAFQYFAKAIELRPEEGLYYENFGDALYVFRKKAVAFYKLDEQKVFLKALEMYSNAVRLDPSKFVFASRLADTYYAIKPFPPEKAARAWTNALHVAKTDLERDGVYVHLARCKMLGGQLEQAKAQLNTVTNPVFSEIKAELTKNLNERQKEAGTNQLPKPTLAP